MTRARLGALLLPLIVAGGFASTSARAQVSEETGEVFVFLVPGVSFEEMLGIPEVAALATNGGAALMTLHNGLPTEGEAGIAPGEQNVHFRWLDPTREGGLEGVASMIVEMVTSVDDGSVLVFVASTRPSPEMIVAKDELHPLVLARGTSSDLFAERGEEGSLTSDSTRRAGVVTDLDVIPTIADFLGVDPPADSNGSPIEIISGPPPFELHKRYLAQRRSYVPIGTAGGIYLAVAGLGAIALLALGSRAPSGLRRLSSRRDISPNSRTRR